MEATLRDKAADFAKEFARNISTAQELNEVMRLMSKSMIERMLQAEMDVHLSQDDTRRAPATATAEVSSAALQYVAATNSRLQIQNEVFIGTSCTVGRK